MHDANNPPVRERYSPLFALLYVLFVRPVSRLEQRADLGWLQFDYDGYDYNGQPRRGIQAALWHLLYELMHAYTRPAQNWVLRHDQLWIKGTPAYEARAALAGDDIPF